MLTIKTKHKEVDIAFNDNHTIKQIINTARNELNDKSELPDDARLYYGKTKLSLELPLKAVPFSSADCKLTTYAVEVKHMKVDEVHKCRVCEYTSNLALMIAHVLTDHVPLPNDLMDNPETDWPQVHSLDAAGMIQEQITIYMRAPAKRLWEILSNSSVIVEGPPGTGKSTLVWLWACHHKGSVAWIFLEDTSCRRLSILHRSKVVLSLPCKIDNSIFRYLQVDCLVLDGATKNNILLDEAMLWRQHAPERQLIITASIQTGIKPERRTRENMSSFFMGGWTEAEYKEALDNAALKAEHNDLMDEDGFEAKYSCAGAMDVWHLG